MIDKYPKCYNKYIIQNKNEYYDDKQNKRKLYTFRHMWIRQALKPANDTRDQALNYANNIKWNTNHNRLLTKTITLVSNRSI